MTGTFERTYRCASTVGSTLRWTQRGHRPAHSSRASSIGSCTTPKSQTTTSVRADTLQRLRVAYWIDVGVAEVVDQVREQLNELAPKRRFLLMRQNVDTYSLAHVVRARAHNAQAHTSRSPLPQRRRACRLSGSPTEIHTIRLRGDPPEPSTMYGPRAANNVLSLLFHLQTAPAVNCRERPRADKRRRGRGLRTGSASMDRSRKRLDGSDAWRLCKTFVSSRKGRWNTS